MTHIVPSSCASWVLEILSVLSTMEHHSHGIMKEVETDSRGKTNLELKTFQGSLDRMIRAGLIDEGERIIGSETKEKHRVHHKNLCPRLKSALTEELRRYLEVMEVVKQNSLHSRHSDKLRKHWKE